MGDLTITRKGKYAVGKIQKGTLKVKNKITCFYPEKDITCVIKRIESLNQLKRKFANEGEIVALKIKGKNIEQIKENDIFIIPGANL